MRRELNEIEYLNWCFGQPYNMVVTVRLRGELRPDELRAALDKAQRRHPLLGVNTEPGPRGVPWFSSEGVGPIPLTVVEGAAADAATKLAERELVATFAMDAPGAARRPLMRVALLLSRDAGGPIDLVFTAQHVIADGLSMLFLVRDLLHFIARPDAPVVVLDAPARDADLIPPRVRRWMPTSRRPFDLALLLARAWLALRGRARMPMPEPGTREHRAFTLTPEQTSRLRARCRAEGVSVQSAVCAAFLPEFGAVHTPVDLRARLARPVGESVGLYVGSADVSLGYRHARGFWPNARRFHHRLRGAMRNPFRVFVLFSKVVPREAMAQLGPLMMRLAGAQRPLAVTNLGQLDARGVDLTSPRLAIESFTGEVSNILASNVLTVFTIGGRMRLDLLANESRAAPTAVRDDAARAVGRLLAAIET